MKMKCVAQLCDADPIEYGGYWVFDDGDCGSAELLIVPEEEGGKYLVYRFDLDRCTYVDGVLADNKYHPNIPAWFAKPESIRKERPQDTTYLKNVALYCEFPEGLLVRQFCSESLIDRAQAYRMVGVYHGFNNLDGYPLELTKLEIKTRYRAKKYKVV
jgi:hypothetical protein